MFRKFAVLFLVLGLLPAPAAIGLPTESDPASKYRLNYDDLDMVLRSVVLEMGRSNHKRAKKPNSGTGTNMFIGNPLPTRLEGNRVMFHQLEDSQVEMLANIRDDMLAVTSQVPLEALTRREQLAYLFNLHTIIVLTEIAERYPTTDIEPMFDPENPDAFYKQRKFNLNGEMISLKDIQEHVLANWKNPVVIYGFYMGAVGTPNIRNNAYTGADVFAQLQNNAIDYVNSVRGTQVWNKTKLRVAKYYERMASQFPNFEDDLMAHLRQYSAGAFRQRLANVEQMRVEVEDWHIADLYNGRMNTTVGSFAMTSQDAWGNNIRSDVPMHVAELLRERQERRARKAPIVEVEEIKDVAMNSGN